jgi:hypothetical protein
MFNLVHSIPHLIEFINKRGNWGLFFRVLLTFCATARGFFLSLFLSRLLMSCYFSLRLINTEIKEQDVLIGGLEKDVDTANEKMNVVLTALGKLLKTKDSCQIWTIIILGLILILLVALVIWA